MSRVILVACGQNMQVEGEVPPAEVGPFIYMFNHESLFDIFLICAVIRPPTTAVGALKQFSMPLWGAVLRRYGAIAIDRHHLNPAIASLQAAEKAIAAGISLVIAPEGTRTLTGKIGRFKKGPFHVALHTGATIVPIGLDGAYQAKNKNDWRIYPGTIRVRIGAPIPATQYSSLSVEELKEVIKTTVTTLAGQ